MKRSIQRYCTGCGLCAARGKALLETDNRGYLHPVTGDEGWLQEVCPVAGCQKTIMEEDNIWGREVGVWRGWSLDSGLRTAASSGGVITELCSYLLDEGLVSGVLHVRADEENPTRTRWVVSRTRKELSESCGSRYAISSPLIALTDELMAQGPYAFVGKPCDVVALRNFMALPGNGVCQEAFPYLISFFCMGLPSAAAQEKLLGVMGSNHSKCKSLTYRGNGWPGFTTAIDTDGTVHRLPYSESWGAILGRDVMPACRFCIDGLGEAADIACGDAWYLTDGAKPDFAEHDGRNVIFARTRCGQSLLDAAAKVGRIHLEAYEDHQDDLQKVQTSQYMRRATLLARLVAMRLLLRPAPKYPLKLLRSYSRRVTIRQRLLTLIGTLVRIVRGVV